MIDTDYLSEASLELEKELTVPDVRLVRQEAVRRSRVRRGLTSFGVIAVLGLAGFALTNLLEQESSLSTTTDIAEVDNDRPIEEATTTLNESPPPPTEENLLVLRPDQGEFSPNALFTVASHEPDGTVSAYLKLERWEGEEGWVDVVAVMIAAEHLGEPRIIPLGEPWGTEDVAYTLATFQLPETLEPGSYRACLAQGLECSIFEVA